MALEVTDENFEEGVLRRSEATVVILELSAEWCEPCKDMASLLGSVVDERPGRATLAVADIDKCPKVQSMFKVAAIPAVYAIKDRKVVTRFVGSQNGVATRDWLTEALLMTANLQ